MEDPVESSTDIKPTAAISEYKFSAVLVGVVTGFEEKLEFMLAATRISFGVKKN